MGLIWSEFCKIIGAVNFKTYMVKTISKILSVVFHPLVMPSLGLLMIYNSGTYVSMLSTEAERIIFLIVAVGTFLLPLSLIPVFIYTRMVSTVEMKERSERFFPLLITSALFYIDYFVLRSLMVPRIIQLFILAATLSVVLTSLINIKWKISAHMVGIGGLIGALLAMSFRLLADISVSLIISIVIAGLLGFARLNLNAHKPSEIYGGLGLGFLTNMLLIIFF